MIKSDIFCPHFIPNTDPDPGSSWLRIQYGSGSTTLLLPLGDFFKPACFITEKRSDLEGMQPHWEASEWIMSFILSDLALVAGFGSAPQKEILNYNTGTGSIFISVSVPYLWPTEKLQWRGPNGLSFTSGYPPPLGILSFPLSMEPILKCKILRPLKEAHMVHVMRTTSLSFMILPLVTCRLPCYKYCTPLPLVLRIRLQLDPHVFPWNFLPPDPL